MPDVRSIGFSFDLGGLPQAMVVFQTILEQALPEVVYDVAIKIKDNLQGKTPVSSKGGSTDKDDKKQDVYHMKDHWSNIFTPYDSASGSVLRTEVVFENPTHYGPMLEFGLYPSEWIHPGGKLVAVAGGVFSTQAPGGILTPLIQDETLDELARNSLQTLLDQLVGMAGS
jgi:hypothetical protein